MGRQKNADRHQELAVGVLRTIVDKGVADFTMADISKRLGVKRSLLYWYFKGGVSDALLAAATLAGEHRAAYTGKRIAAVAHPVERLDAWVCASYAFGAGEKGAKGAVAQVQAAAGAGLVGQDAHVAPLIEALQEGLADRRVASCEPAAVVALCAAAVDGALLSTGASGASGASGRGGQGGAGVAAIDALRAAVIKPLHTGNWQPAPLNPASGMTSSGNAAGSAGNGAGADPVLAEQERDEAPPQQVVKPVGTWLELD